MMPYAVANPKTVPLFCHGLPRIDKQIEQDLFDLAESYFRGSCFLGRKGGIALDPYKQIIEIMGHAAGQGADGFHLFGNDCVFLSFER
jgi:hypothetical protein